MNNEKPLLENLDPDIVGFISRSKETIAKANKVTGVLATTIISTGVLAGTAFGSGAKLPDGIRDVLNCFNT